MFNKLLLVAALVLPWHVAMAQVDVNKADAAALDGIKGIGPSMSKEILEQRAKGEFKDWADLQSRVKGLGEKKAAKLSEAGLLVNGKGKDGAAVVKPQAAKPAAPAAKQG